MQYCCKDWCYETKWFQPRILHQFGVSKTFDISSSDFITLNSTSTRWNIMGLLPVHWACRAKPWKICIVQPYTDLKCLYFMLYETVKMSFVFENDFLFLQELLSLQLSVYSSLIRMYVNVYMSDPLFPFESYLFY